MSKLLGREPALLVERPMKTYVCIYMYTPSQLHVYKRSIFNTVSVLAKRFLSTKLLLEY